MRRRDLQELHYITPINNVLSMAEKGILSHKHTDRIQHDSVAMQEIQDRRAKKVVPGGRPLHEYVNLYINARNKMMFKVHSHHEEICILRIDPAILDMPGVIITDQNASSNWAIFMPAPEGLRIVDRDLVFAERWTHPDQREEWRRGSAINAEVLVPDRVGPEYITGAYVSCNDSNNTFVATGAAISVTTNPRMFFR